MSGPITIAVDFGETSSSVAYAANEELIPQPLPIHPDKTEKSSQLQTTTTAKSPTVLYYKKEGEQVGKPDAWSVVHPSGVDSEGLVARVNFRKFLDPDKRGRDISKDQALSWCTEFLRELIFRVVKELKVEYPQAVNFFFTIPAVWDKKLPIINDFKHCLGESLKQIQQSLRFSYTFTVGLVNPVATAIYQIMSYPRSFTVRDRIVSCDAGGATTDVSFVTVTSHNGAEIIGTTGGEVGSSTVDDACFKYLRDSGAMIDLSNYMDTLKQVHQIKRDFTGFPSGRSVITIGGKVIELDLETIQSWFDAGIAEIATLIDVYLRFDPQWILLSGGFSTNRYVLRSFNRRYGHIIGGVISSFNPLFAPSLGQVYQALNTPREATMSWGCVIVPLDSAASDVAPSSDPANSEKIQWFVEQGTSMYHMQWFTVNKSYRGRVFRLHVVTCGGYVTPNSMIDANVEQRYRITINVRSKKLTWLFKNTISAMIRVYRRDKVVLRISIKDSHGAEMKLAWDLESLPASRNPMEIIAKHD